MGTYNQAILDFYINEFNKLYPNITVRPEYMGNYDSLHDQIKVEISVGDQPNIPYCYPDHVALYNMANVVVTMDSFMYSDIPVYQANGAAEIMGFADYQLADFFPGFMEGTRVYGDGMSYTLPMSKSTEVLYYNKTYFEANNYEVPKTWD
jgi:multiple sugar transport system substrate-binding protein